MINLRSLLILAGLAMVAVVGTMLLGPDGNDAPAPGPAAPNTTQEEDSATTDTVQSSVGSNDTEPERVAIQLDDEMDPESQERASLAITGRVTDSAGNPIMGALVQASHRQSFRRMARRDTNWSEMARNWSRNRDQAMRDMRDRFRAQPVGDVVESAADGTFQLQGEAYEEASLTIVAAHQQYAPSVMQRDWSGSAGELRLSDIVLAPGVVVDGIVIDDAGAPVPGALVGFDNSRSSGRGGWGGFRGFGGGRGGFGGDDELLAQAIGQVETRADGSFRMGPVPADPFRLRAESEEHLDSNSERLEPNENQALPLVEIVMPRAVTLSGVVTDPNGKPIANVEVTGDVSRSEGRNGRRGQRGSDNGNNSEGRGRRGRDDNRGGRGNDRGSSSNASTRETTKTNAAGEFELTKMPRRMLRVTTEHEDFLRKTDDPIDVTTQSSVVIVMDPAMVARGTVVDVQSGEPIETFGIAVRRTGRNDWGRGGRGDDGGRRGRGGDRNRDDDREEAQRQVRESLLGESGRTPGRTPDPTAHPEGKFVIRPIQVGQHVFDVDAPGYVKTTSATINAEEGADLSNIVIKMERGALLRGLVLDQSRAPVNRARVEILVPENEEGEEEGRGRGRGGFRGFRGWNSSNRIAEATTGQDGTFELPPVRSGIVRLRVTKRGMLDYEDSAFQLPRVGQAREITIRMTSGGIVHGSVYDLDPGASAQVVLTSVDNNERKMGSVDSATGTYTINGIESGEYYVNLFARNGGEDAIRSMLASALAQRERGRPDVVVTPGSKIRFDLSAAEDPMGSVSGTVFWNGSPKSGLDIRLQRTDSSDNAEDGRGGRDGRIDRIASQLLRTRTDDLGRFEITKVPAGEYTVSVSVSSEREDSGRGGRGSRRGRGSSRSVHKQAISVSAYSPTLMDVEFQTAQLEIAILLPPEVGETRPRITLVDATEAEGKPENEWRRLESAQSLTVRDGTTGPQELQPGNYRYRVSGRGLAATTGDLTVTLGQPNRVEVAVLAAPVDPTQPNSGRGGGGGGPNGRGGGGGGRNGGGGGGGRNGGGGGGPNGRGGGGGGRNGGGGGGGRNGGGGGGPNGRGGGGGGRNGGGGGGGRNGGGGRGGR